MTALIVLGVVVGYMVPCFIGPGRDDIRSAARDLVPAGARVTQESEKTGSSLIVGPYQATVRFKGGATNSDQLLSEIRDLARAQGWKETEPGAFSGADMAYFRGGVIANVAVLSTLVEGSIRA